MNRSPQAASGRSLPIVTPACAGQVECERLVSPDANGWSVAMQMSGQVRAITQVSLSAAAFQAENYVIIDNWAITFQAQGFTYVALIADSPKNRIIQSAANIGASNDRRFDKVSCTTHDMNQKGKLVRYRVIAAPIDA